PAVEGPIEDHVTGGDDAAAPYGEALANLPHAAAGGGVPGDERAHVSARPGVIRRRRSDVRRAGDVRDLGGLIIHAQVVGRDVEPAGVARVRRRRDGTLPAFEAGTDVLHVAAQRTRGFR